MSDQKKENPDNHQYNMIGFRNETIKFLIKSYKFYESLLLSDLNAIKSDEFLNDLINEDVIENSQIQIELNKIKRYLEWFKRNDKEDNKSFFDVPLSPTHGNVRHFKSVCFLYINILKVRRNKVLEKENFSLSIIQAIDSEIDSWEECFDTGVFCGASLMPLLVDQEVQISKETAIPVTISTVKTPKPIMLSNVQIVDKELKARCLDLFDKFEEESTPERFDTVVTEATRVLENRLRELTGATKGETGDKLVSMAFGGKSPKFIISEVSSENEAAPNLFRGMFGYIRNPTHHKLNSAFTSARVMQILGFIDYLLHIIDICKPKEPTSG